MTTINYVDQAKTATIAEKAKSLVRSGVRLITRSIYNLKDYGQDNIPSSGGVLLLGNHVTLIDWAIIQSACPRPIRFVIDRSFYSLWYMNWFFKIFNVIPIARSGSQNALLEVNKALNNGEVVVLFPEGRLTKNGQMGAFHSGFERSAVNADAVIVPFYINGLWGSKTSYGKKYNKKTMNSNRINIAYGEPLSILSKAQMVKQKVAELSIQSWQHHVNEMANLQTEWLSQMKKAPSSTALIEDNGQKTSNRELLSNTLYLSRKLKPLLTTQQNIAILLPNTKVGILSTLSVLVLGKACVHLNVAMDSAALVTTMEQASVSTIITSRQFLTKLESKNPDFIKGISTASLIYIEDLMNGQRRYFMSALTRIMPTSLLKLLFLRKASHNSTAAILFTNDNNKKLIKTELSQANLLSSINQVATAFGIEDGDVVINSSPLSDAFGLAVTTLMPLLKGVTIVCHPEANRTLAIAKLICKYKVTHFCSSPELLENYIKNNAVHPRMLHSLRMVIAEGDAVSISLYKEFKEKFNLEIYESYGLPEIAAIVSCNLPDVVCSDDWHVQKFSKKGTVGLPLPGHAFRIVDPQTFKVLSSGLVGLVLIGKTQIDSKVLSQTDEFLVPDDSYSWYKTGDQGYLDEDGFLTLVEECLPDLVSDSQDYSSASDVLVNV